MATRAVRRASAHGWRQGAHDTPFHSMHASCCCICTSNLMLAMLPALVAHHMWADMHTCLVYSHCHANTCNHIAGARRFWAFQLQGLLPSYANAAYTRLHSKLAWSCLIYRLHALPTADVTGSTKFCHITDQCVLCCRTNRSNKLW